MKLPRTLSFAGEGPTESQGRETTDSVERIEERRGKEERNEERKDERRDEGREEQGSLLFPKMEFFIKAHIRGLSFL